MTPEEINEHALRIIGIHNEEYDFSLVYEDEELADAAEEEWTAIHDAMNAGHIYVEWEE